MQRTRGLLLALTILTLVSCTSARMSQEMSGGKAAFESGYYKEAFHELLPVAVSGKAEAQYAVGYMYYYGYGVPQDSESGEFWMNKAAQQNYAPAVKALEMIHNQDTTSRQTSVSVNTDSTNSFKPEQMDAENNPSKDPILESLRDPALSPKSVADDASAMNDPKPVSDNTVAMNDAKSVTDNTVAMNDAKPVTDNTIGMNDSKPVADNTVAMNDAKSVTDNTIAMNDSKSVSDNTDAMNEPKSVAENTNAMNESNPVSDNAYAMNESNQDQIAEVSASTVKVAQVTQPKSMPQPIQAAKPKLIHTKQVATAIQRKQLFTPHDFTLQLFGSYQLSSVKELQTQYALQKNSYILKTKHNGQDWFVVTYGKYETAHQASTAKKQLASNLKDLNPWIREVDSSLKQLS